MSGKMEWPVIKLLLVDDAPEFKLVTAWLALCWVHEARHYKKLNPMVAHHQQVLDTFMTLSQTAKKLNVSFYHYIHDRISAAYALPNLADLIFEQAHTLDLDASWLPP